MTISAKGSRMTVEQYLVWERTQAEKHDFVDGEVFAMAGGSPRHNALAAAVLAELRIATRGTVCRPLTSDQRVALPRGERFVYPDASLACDPLEVRHNDVLANPTAIVEVLSTSTEAYDRGDKWEGYRRIASLEDYLLVSQHAIRIEQFQRHEDGSWRYTVAEQGDRVTLHNGAAIDVSAIYDGAFELPADEPGS
jgi:Uma2 family endonuclease